MKNIVFNQKPIVSILVVMLVICALPGISYGSSDDISVAASTDSPLTEATLHESVVTLTLSGGAYEQSGFKIRDALEVSGIDGVTVATFGVDRVSDTEITVELEFEGNIDTDATLTFTIGADAIEEYNGPPLTAQIPVTAIMESVVASTDSPLTEATLHESVVTLTLSGRTYARIFDIRDAVTVAGISGVTVGTFAIKRVSDTEVTIELEFDGNIDTDATLIFTVGADAIVGYNGPSLTAQIPVTATTEAEDPVTEDEEPDGGQPPEQPEQPEQPLVIRSLTLEEYRSPVLSVAFSPDGTILASGAGDNTVKLWDVATSTNIATLEGHTDEVYSVAFSPDGTMLASASRDRTIKLWNVATGSKIATLEGHNSCV